MPPKVMVHFAEQDAVRVYVEQGKLRLVIKLAELSQGRDRKWRDFTVQAYYVPVHEGLEARLVRDGTIELVGPRFGLGEQIAVRGIFTKVLSSKRTLSLVPQTIAKDPRLAKLTVDQFVVDNGWIGLSLTAPRVDKPVVAGQNRPQSR
jgi:hypothetical protein